jgi:hypothetical protein
MGIGARESMTVRKLLIKYIGGSERENAACEAFSSKKVDFS